MYYTLEELSNYQDSNLKLVVEIDDGETTRQKVIFTNDNFNFFMRNVYGKRILIKECDSLQDAFTTFVDYFVYYKTIFQDDLNRLYNAWITDYNPLENYDRQENSSTDLLHGETHTISGSGQHSLSKTDTASGTDKTTISGRTHGNIGVTTSQQMLQSEVDLRMKMQIENFVKLIVDKFTIMI